MRSPGLFPLVSQVADSGINLPVRVQCGAGDAIIVLLRVAGRIDAYISVTLCFFSTAPNNHVCLLKPMQ